MESVDTPRRAQLRYQRQDSDQTLEEAVTEYYRANLGRVTRPAELAPKSAALFCSHDICHVIFGLDTSLADETLVDIRTVLSSDVGLRRYLAYLAQDDHAKALFAELGVLRALGATLRALPRILRAVAEALGRRKPWPWTPPAAYARRSLAELRREHRIRVI